MIDALLLALTLVAALGSGLVAGVFFAFSVFVMKALARLPSPQGIAAMQAINVAAISPGFMAALFGTAAVCLVLAVAAIFTWDRPGAFYLLSGGVLYLVGTILVTMLFNVPRNQALKAVSPESADGAALWASYLADWTTWNHVRTATSLAAAATFIVAMW